MSQRCSTWNIARGGQFAQLRARVASMSVISVCPSFSASYLNNRVPFLSSQKGSMPSKRNWKLCSYFPDSSFRLPHPCPQSRAMSQRCSMWNITRGGQFAQARARVASMSVISVCPSFSASYLNNRVPFLSSQKGSMSSKRNRKLCSYFRDSSVRTLIPSPSVVHSASLIHPCPLGSSFRLSHSSPPPR